MPLWRVRGKTKQRELEKDIRVQCSIDALESAIDDWQIDENIDDDEYVLLEVRLIPSDGKEGEF